MDSIEGHRDGLRDLSRLLHERWRAGLVFVVIGLLAIIGLKVAIPESEAPNMGILSKKIEFLRENHDDYNVLFIGTSRTYRGVDPVLLQQVAEDHGCDVRAFNLGVPKLRLTELRHLADRLEPNSLADYDLILVAKMSLSGIRTANWGTNRVNYFMDWEGYYDSLIDLWHVPFPGIRGFAKKLLLSARLTGAFAYRQLGIGRLAADLRGDESPSGDNTTGDRFDGGAIVDFSRHGFVALEDEPHEQFSKRGEVILRNPDFFERLKARPVNVDDFRGAKAEAALKRFTWSMDHIDGFDAPVAMFLPPMLHDLAPDQALAEQAAANGLPVMNLNRLDLYPELFDRQHWFDYSHHGRSGAELLSTMIGERICPLIAEAGT